MVWVALNLLKLPASIRISLHIHSTGFAKFSTSRCFREDPRLKELGKVISDEYSVIRQDYDTPRNPIILAHGLLGFNELHLAGQSLPGIQYWRGIREALAHKDIEVITASVPPSGSIEARAAKLAESIAEKAHGRSVNIIAYVLGRFIYYVFNANH
jgi:triacylglycerol lipase